MFKFLRRWLAKKSEPKVNQNKPLERMQIACARAMLAHEKHSGETSVPKNRE